MSRPTHRGNGLGSPYLTGFSVVGPDRPDLTPTAPAYDRHALEEARRTCHHGPYYVDAASGITCVRCGAFRPGEWTWQCLQGYQG
jgi:hypothetical protein